MIILSVELDMPFAFWAWLREWRCAKPYKDISRSKLYPRLKTLLYTLLPDDSLKFHQKNYGPGDFQAIPTNSQLHSGNPLAAKVWIFTAEIILRIMSAPQVDLGDMSTWEGDTISWGFRELPFLVKFIQGTVKLVKFCVLFEK